MNITRVIAPLLSIFGIGAGQQTAVQVAPPPHIQPMPDVERVIERIVRRDGNVTIFERETVYRNPGAATLPPVVVQAPTKLTSFKLVRVDESGRFLSLAGLGDGATTLVYQIGDTLREPALPEHGGGLYSFLMKPGQIVQSFLEGRIWDLHPGEYGVIETEVMPPFVGYSPEGVCLGYVDDPFGTGGKFAASAMRVKSCAVRFAIEPYQTGGYYAHQRRTGIRLITREIYGQVIKRVETFE